MKRLFSILVLLSLVGGVAFAYDADGNPNTKRETASTAANIAYREYQLVHFAENAPNAVGLSAGDVVVADCVSDDGVTVALVGATNSTDAVRGVVVSATIPTCDVVGTGITSDVGRRNWGYIQVRGLCQKVNITSGGAAGSTLSASPTARYAQPTTITAGTTFTFPRTLGFAYDASSQGQAKADIEI